MQRAVSDELDNIAVEYYRVCTIFTIQLSRTFTFIGRNWSDGKAINQVCQQLQVLPTSRIVCAVRVAITLLERENKADWGNFLIGRYSDINWCDSSK
jgi:hypothetical protein